MNEVDVAQAGHVERSCVAAAFEDSKHQLEHAGEVGVVHNLAPELASRGVVEVAGSP